MRLIDADALEDMLTIEEEDSYVKEWLYEMPTIDAAPVVHCKDCIHEGMSDCPLCMIENHEMIFINHDSEFYCAHGAKMNEEVK